MPNAKKSWTAVLIIVFILTGTGYAQNKILDIHTKNGDSFIDVTAGKYENDTLYFISDSSVTGIAHSDIKSIRYKRKGFALAGFITGFLAGAGYAASTLEDGEVAPSPVPAITTTCAGGFLGGVVGGLIGAVFGIDSKYEMDKYKPEEQKVLLFELAGDGRA